MDGAVTMQLIYLAISVALTVWVGRILFRNGRVFLLDVFGGNEEAAAAVNRLLVAGFYLVTLGYVALTLRTGGRVVTARESLQTLSTKIGVVLLVLGVVHFVNLFVLSRIRRRGQRGSSADDPATSARGDAVSRSHRHSDV